MLLLWATDPLLPRALEVIDAWGFTYKTVGFYWVKLNKSAASRLSTEWPLLAERDFFTGLGFWTRANPEPCSARDPRPAQALAATCLSYCSRRGASSRGSRTKPTS